MFDIAFTEIMVIMVVALVVIGPERLPQVARKLGKWWGGLQRYVNQVKQDVNSGIALEELREAERKVKAEAASIEQSLHDSGKEVSAGLKQIEQELAGTDPEPKAPVTPGEVPPTPKNTP